MSDRASRKERFQSVAAETLAIIEAGGYNFTTGTDNVFVPVVSRVEDSVCYSEFEGYRRGKSAALRGFSCYVSLQTTMEAAREHADKRPKRQPPQTLPGVVSPRAGEEQWSEAPTTDVGTPEPPSSTRTAAVSSPPAPPLAVEDEELLGLKSGKPEPDQPKRVAVLNFASANKPGGGFLNGAVAQEEVLARSSTLYPSLLPHGGRFYGPGGSGATVPDVGSPDVDSGGALGSLDGVEDDMAALSLGLEEAASSSQQKDSRGLKAKQNAHAARPSNAASPATSSFKKKFSKNQKSPLYTDRIIYSQEIVFFRDDSTELLGKPYAVDVLTCAAVNRGLAQRTCSAEEIEACLVQRCEKVLKCALLHGVDVFVLGAWGTGVFRNPAELVAGCFAKAMAAVLGGRVAERAGGGSGGKAREMVVVFAVPNRQKAEVFAEVLGCELRE